MIIERGMRICVVLLLLIGVSVCLQCCSDKFTRSTDLTSYRNTIFKSGGSKKLEYAPCSYGSPYSGLQCDGYAAACLEITSVSHSVGDKALGVWKSPTKIFYPASVGHDGIKRSLTLNIVCGPRDSTDLSFTSLPDGANAIAYHATISISSSHCNLKTCPAGSTEAGGAVILLFFFCCCCVPLCCCCGVFLLIVSAVIGFLKFAAREAIDEGVRDILYGDPRQPYNQSNQAYDNPGYQ